MNIAGHAAPLYYSGALLHSLVNVLAHQCSIPLTVLRVHIAQHGCACSGLKYAHPCQNTSHHQTAGENCLHKPRGRVSTCWPISTTASPTSPTCRLHLSDSVNVVCINSSAWARCRVDEHDVGLGICCLVPQTTRVEVRRDGQPLGAAFEGWGVGCGQRGWGWGGRRGGGWSG